MSDISMFSHSYYSYMNSYTDHIDRFIITRGKSNASYSIL